MKLWLWLVLAPAAVAGESYSFWVQPCTSDLAESAHCENGDPELAVWALQAWERAARGAITFVKSPEEARARIRIYWAPANLHMYGEARPIAVDGQIGAAIYVRPDLAQLGPDIAAAGSKDRLFRHGVVYLTCLHESGHAIGLAHTANFEDIMYSFQFGGDILEYFQRYRRLLERRDQIRECSGISKFDERRLLAIYGR